MRLFWGCFWSFWGSDLCHWGQKCVPWPPWMWMSLDRAVDWVWIRIKGRRNMISTPFQRCLGKCVYFRGIFGLSRVLVGVHGSWMCGLAILDVD